MSALLSPVNTNTAVVVESTADLHERAVRAVLKGITHAAARHDSGAVANFGAALSALEGGN